MTSSFCEMSDLIEYKLKPYLTEECLKVLDRRICYHFNDKPIGQAGVDVTLEIVKYLPCQTELEV